jgi:transposase-like protein
VIGKEQAQVDDREKAEQQVEVQEAEGATAGAAPAEGTAERSGAGPGAGAEARGRPGRRTAAERREAVLAILTGKSTVDKVAAQYGVLPETVEKWRDQSLAAIEDAMRFADTRTSKEREIERENRELRDLVSKLSVERALAIKAVEEWKKLTRPSRPARSRK